MECIKGTVSRDFLLLVFFMNQFPRSPRVFQLDSFEFFRKFAEIFASQGAPPVSTTPVTNLPQVINNTGGKFFHNFRWRCWYRWQTMGTIIKLTWKKIYLYANSTSQRCPVQKKSKKFSDWRFFPFATGVNDIGGKPWAANISANFRKNSKRP